MERVNENTGNRLALYSKRNFFIMSLKGENKYKYKYIR